MAKQKRLPVYEEQLKRIMREEKVDKCKARKIVNDRLIKLDAKSSLHKR